MDSQKEIWCLTGRTFLDLILSDSLQIQKIIQHTFSTIYIPINVKYTFQTKYRDVGDACGMNNVNWIVMVTVT